MNRCAKCGRIKGVSHACRNRLGWEDFFWRFYFAVNRNPDGCWLWSGALNAKGYGWTQLEGGRGAKKVLAHRYSYFLANGEFPETLCVLHRCDTPRCVRPDHLFLGTPKDNSQDMAAKGRAYLQRASREVQLASAAHMREKRGW